MVEGLRRPTAFPATARSCPSAAFPKTTSLLRSVGVGVWGFGLGVGGWWFGLWGLGLGVWGVRFRVWDFGGGASQSCQHRNLNDPGIAQSANDCKDLSRGPAQTPPRGLTRM